jgi:hypothetical protein
MNAVAEAFKGYQYYEFNIIKDLVEPSKRLADSINNTGLDQVTAKKKIDSTLGSGDDQLLNLNDQAAQNEKTQVTEMDGKFFEEFDNFLRTNKDGKQKKNNEN